MGDVATQMMEMARSDGYKFSLDSPTAVLRPQQSGGSGGEARPDEPPADKISEFRLIADTDPHVGEGIDTLVDYIVGSGFNIEPANIPGTDQEQTDQDISDLKKLVETSDFASVLDSWVWHALVDGTAFLEIVVEDDVFKPKVLPTEDINMVPNEFGDLDHYEMDTGGSDPIEFAPYDLAVLRFHRHPDESFGHSIIERVQEQADMMRDMEIDLARFIATKAYPPVLWKCGTEERPWTQDQIDSWLDETEQVEPDSMLAVGHDVEHEVVGTTSTSSSAGMLNLDSTFEHLIDRVATGLGVPFLSGEGGKQTTQISDLPKFDRRVQRYRNTVSQAVRYQVFVSILAGDSDPAEYTELPPDFEFGKHSSEEERLDADMAIKLVNNGLLSRDAAAKRVGIDPETELPKDAELDELIATIQALQGAGDDIQNPEGGRPTDTGGGAQSAGREAKTEKNPEDDSSSNSDRPQQGVEQE